MTSPSLHLVPLPHGASSACLGAELPKEPGKLSLFHSIDPDCPDLWLSPGISDGCKIRKIKCTETSPCEGCVKAGIACTFVKHPSARGPRNLRKSTLKEIRQTQQQGADQTHRPWTEIGMVAGEGGPITVPPTVSGLHAGEPGL
jgi:Fungal Zn(2)-Cys(6) binuclear cluster domain